MLILSCWQTSILQAQPSTFKHTVTTYNIARNFTKIDHPRTNNQPQKILFVTHDYGSGPYVKSPIGVWYTGNKWSIFQQDLSPLPKGAKFNVLVQTTADRGVFIHTAKSGNISGHTTMIDNPNTNNKPNAKIIVTQNWRGIYNNHEIGVHYYKGKWYIFNQDKKPLPVGARFNIMVDHSKSFQHTVSSNSYSHITSLNHANTNNSPDAFVFVTQRKTKIYNPHSVGVRYSGGKWKIYNEDRAKMPSNAKFNVVAFSLKNTNTPSASKDLTGTYKCSNGGLYYIRQIGNKAYWFGEHPNGSFANVMSGVIRGNTISGKWWDVPKGRAQNKGSIKLKFSADKKTITHVSGGGSGRTWKRIPLPSSLPNQRAAQYGGRGYANLSGLWKGNDRGNYYINDKDGEVVWVGEAAFSNGTQPAFVNIFIGKCNSTTVEGIWVDVPKGKTRGNGTMTLHMKNRGRTLTKAAVTGGFGGSVFNKVVRGR